MTISSARIYGYCEDCTNFDVIICDKIGVCVEIRSSHNRHILDASHPGCPFWKERK